VVARSSDNKYTNGDLDIYTLAPDMTANGILYI
jgi:hypothetical protein